MVRAAGRACRHRPDAAARVARFILASALPDGGFRDRSGASDLYYTVFALQALCALRGDQESLRGGSPDLPRADPIAALTRGGSGEPPREGSGFDPAIARSGGSRRAEAGGDILSAAERYLRSFADGAALDFVHACCLARCWALLATGGPEEPVRQAILASLESWRSSDGGYHATAGAAAGTAYANFLALGAYEDFDTLVPEPAGLLLSLAGLTSADGGYANAPGAIHGSTSATAAALMTLNELGQPVDRRAATWLLAQHCPEGGFRAMPAAPVPDLLSTATALHALAQAGAALEDVRGPCREFVEGLWDRDGGFRGHWADDEADCEYTFYGLLALGHLVI
jgi:prenyltransferase beta subunit